jgi:hypothetical protein
MSDTNSDSTKWSIRVFNIATISYLFSLPLFGIGCCAGMIHGHAEYWEYVAILGYAGFVFAAIGWGTAVVLSLIGWKRGTNLPGIAIAGSMLIISHLVMFCLLWFQL